MRNYLTKKLLYSKINFHTNCVNNAKEIKFGNEGKSLLLKGAETLANVVSLTLGPNSSSVIVSDYIKPKISKDGAFVANSITLSDQYENIGAQIMKKLAETTHKQCNNGSKIATVLAIEMAKEGFKKVMRGSNPVQIRKGILDGVKVANNYLDTISKKVETKDDVKKIAAYFADGDENLGEIVANAIELVGKDGVISVNEAEGDFQQAQLSRGMIFESSLYMRNFPLDKSGGVKLENALLLIYNRRFDNFKAFISLLEYAISKHKPLVVLAEDFAANIAITLAINSEAAVGVKFATVKIPNNEEFDKDILKDLAFASGGKVFGDESCGLKPISKIDDSFIGEVPEIVFTKNEMICIHGSNELLLKKTADLKEEIENTTDKEIKLRLEKRLKMLETNVALISIDASDEEKAKETKEKIYSIIENTKSSMEEGIVPGGGVALLRCAEEVEQMKIENNDYKLGVKILKNCLNAPFNTIIKNSKENPASILYKIQKLPLDIGYDVTSQSYVNVYETGIIDPTKTVKSALTNAANTASLMVNAEAIVVYKFDGTEIVL